MGYWIKCIVPVLLILLLSAEVRAVDAHSVLSVSSDCLEPYGSAELLSPYDGAEQALHDLLTLRLSLFSQPAEVVCFTQSSGIKWLYRLAGLFPLLDNQRFRISSSCLLTYQRSVFLGRGSGTYLYRLGHLLI